MVNENRQMKSEKFYVLINDLFLNATGEVLQIFSVLEIISRLLPIVS
ncbi:MAG: hypothetical protein ACR2N3_13145 [Pyrinomonadaceae bacterium]